MKNITLIIATLLILPLGISAKSSKKPSAPTITVFPAVYVRGQALEFVGSGYQGGDIVTIELNGTSPETIYFTVGAGGSFDLVYPTGFLIQPGYYEVTTSQGSTQSNEAAAAPATGFQVE